MTTIVRVSTLAGYPDCPRRAATRLVRREIGAAGFRLQRVARGVGAVIGTAVHHGVAIMLRNKATTGELPPAPVAQEAARARLETQFGEGETTFDGATGVTHNRGDAVDQTVKMVLAYQLAVAPSVKPILVEERLEAEVEPGLVLSGQPDLVAREPQSVRDLKSGTRMPTSYAPQLGGYSLLARTTGIDIQRASIDFVSRVRRRAPQPAPTSSETVVQHAETAAASILKHIAGDLETFRNGDPARRILPGDPWAFTANPSSLLCSPKYCSAWGTDFCHEGRKFDG